MKIKLLIAKPMLVLAALLVQHPNVFAQAESQKDQAQARIDAASSQIESAKIQARAQGVNQTQQLAEQLRQSASSVAQDMQSIVSSTKAVSEVQNPPQAQASPQGAFDREIVTSNLPSSTFRQPDLKNSGNYNPDTATKPSPSSLQNIRPPDPSAVGF